MDEELKKLLILSTQSIKGLTDSLTKKESVGEANIKAAVDEQRLTNTDLLTDIKKTLQDALKHQIKTAKEQEFESKKAKKVLGKKPKGSFTAADVKEVAGEVKKMGWLKKLLVIVTAILGFGVGMVIGVFQSIWNFFKVMGRIFIGIGKIFGPMIKAIKAFFGMIGKFFGRIFGKNSRIGKLFSRIGKFIGTVVRSVKNFFGAIVRFFAKIFGPKSFIAKIFARITKFLQPVFALIRGLFGGGGAAGGKGFFSVIKKVFGIMVRVGKTFGRLLGPIGIVITVIMSIFDFVKGFKGTEGGFLDKMLGGLGELFAGLIGMPLDLIRKGIAWIFEKFGWEKMAAKLRSFSFASGIKEFFKKIPDFIENIKTTVTKIKDAIGDFFGGDNKLGNVIALLFWPINLIRGIIRFIKGFKEGEGSFFDKVVSGLKTTFGPFIETMKAAFKLIWSTEEPIGFINKIGGFFAMVGGFFGTAFTSAWTALTDGIKAAIAFVWNKEEPQGIINKIGGFFTMIKDKFINWTEESALIQGALDVMNKIKGFFTRIGEAFSSFKPSEGLLSAAQKLKDGKGIGSGAAASTLETVAGLLTKIGLRSGGVLPVGTGGGVPAMLHGPEAVIPLPNMGARELTQLSGQLAMQAANAGMGGGGSMGGTNQVINSSPSTVTNILTQDRFNSEIESLISA